jgi:3-methyladenine DNA glycosylase AlkC
MPPPLKDFVDRDLVQELAERFVDIHPSFDSGAFVATVSPTLDALELKDRIASIAQGLRDHLPSDFQTALSIVVAVARAEPPMSGWSAWPLCTFVELFGVDDPEPALAAMEHLTKRASCEFAIRPFLIEHFEAAYATLQEFTTSPNEDVRRLASEGTRPRLPWGKRVPTLMDDPTIGLSLIAPLRHDASELVRRSVANHLNDISKTHPDLVTDTARQWLQEEPPADRRMIEHALRTLVKQGSPEAMSVLGFSSSPSVVVDHFDVIPNTIAVGDSIVFAASVRSTGSSTQHLIVDFVIHHVNAGGTTTPKVFKWTRLQLEPGDTASLRRKRTIRHGSTRTYRTGRHRVDLQVGGRILAQSHFDIQQA